MKKAEAHATGDRCRQAAAQDGLRSSSRRRGKDGGDRIRAEGSSDAGGSIQASAAERQRAGEISNLPVGPSRRRAATQEVATK